MPQDAALFRKDGRAKCAYLAVSGQIEVRWGAGASPRTIAPIGPGGAVLTP